MKPSNTIIVSSEQIVGLNAIIHNQREKLRTLEEDKSILKKEKVELLKKIDELEKKLNKAEDAIREAYWKCENCYKGVCQYCLNSGVKCYMQGNKVESVGKLKEKLYIATKGLKFISSQSDRKDMLDCAKGTLKKLEELDK